MTKRLRLEGMDQRHWALTPALASSYKEAAEVCLSRHYQSPVEVTLSDNSLESQGELSWSQPDDRALAAWANTIDATEAGAYGCVIAGVEELRGLFAVRRAETGTGVDYYLAGAGTGTNDLEDCLRLEVSGVNTGKRRDVNSRLLQKIRQAREGKSSLPALAGVFGFHARLLMVRDVLEA